MEQQLGLWFYAAIASIIVGVILWFKDSKQRDENGEWSNALQWAYILLIMGIAGILLQFFNWSFAALLLTYTAVSGFFWMWRRAAVKKEEHDANHLRDYLSGFFPIIAVIFVVRSFLFEPFIIPSSSMRPGLIKGDFILVNKFSYGIRVPVLNSVAIETGKVKRGDVAVFNYPLEPDVNYIKRIVAIPGDELIYKDKVLYINGVAENSIANGEYSYADDSNAREIIRVPRFQAGFPSDVMEQPYDVLKVAAEPSVRADTWHYFQHLTDQKGLDHSWLDSCEYTPDGSAFRCILPENKYFAMGDNRDHSADSRYWGFVDDSLLVGRAGHIFLNFGDLGRIGTKIR